MLVWRIGWRQYRSGPYHQPIITMRTCTTIAQLHPTPDGKPGAWVMLAGPDVSLIEQHANVRAMLGKTSDEYCEVRVQDDDAGALKYSFLSTSQEAAKAKRLAENIERAKAANKPKPEATTPLPLSNPVITPEIKPVNPPAQPQPQFRKPPK